MIYKILDSISTGVEECCAVWSQFPSAGCSHPTLVSVFCSHSWLPGLVPRMRTQLPSSWANSFGTSWRKNFTSQRWHSLKGSTCASSFAARCKERCWPTFAHLLRSAVWTAKTCCVCDGEQPHCTGSCVLGTPLLPCLQSQATEGKRGFLSGNQDRCCSQEGFPTSISFLMESFLRTLRFSKAKKRRRHQWPAEQCLGRKRSKILRVWEGVVERGTKYSWAVLKSQWMRVESRLWSGFAGSPAGT